MASELMVYHLSLIPITILMPTLSHRQTLIQDKRKQTPRRQFVMEICSWYFLTLYNRDGHACRYPDTPRRHNVISREEYKQLGAVPTFDYGGVSFFDDLQTFFFQIPKEDRLFFYGGNENVEYTDGTFGAKNAYLSYEVGMGSQNVCYSNVVYDNCSDVFSSQSVTDNCSNIYSSAYVTKSFNIFYSRYIHNSSNSYFSTNLTGCHDCIACDSLHNKSYCYQNQQLTKQAYTEIKKELLTQQASFDTYYQQVITTLGNCIATTDSEGSALFNTHDVRQSHCVSNLKHGRNVVLFEGLKNSTHVYDSLHTGANVHHFYGVSHAGENAEHVYIGNQVGRSNNIYYSFNIESCSYCLGCTGLKNKQFCIFNKQYTKEERHKRADQIFAQMEADGALGNFFPGSMNPFYFNDTVAYLLDDSFTRQEVEAAGYLRRDQAIKTDIPEGVDVVQTTELSQYEGCQGTQRHIDPAILKVIIQDPDGNYYRIVRMEYEFLVKHRLPLPRHHRLTRLKSHFTLNA